MVKNMLGELCNARFDAKVLGTVKELLRDAQGTNDLVIKKDIINKAFRKLYDIKDDDNTYMLSEIISLSLDLAGNGAVLSNNIDRCLAVAIKEVRECETRIENKTKNI